MKEFFKISDSVEKKVIASAYPQVDVEGFEGFDLWGANSYTSTPLEGPINFSVVFPKLILQEHAILTDMLSSPIGSKYMMISERLFELFSKFTMDNYQYFTENVHTPKGSVAYKLLYLNTPRDDDFLDWKHCQFYDLNGPQNEIFTVADAKDYYHVSMGRVLRSGRIVVKPLQPSFDIFRCLYFSGGNRFYVSSHLKQAMEHAGITGVSFESMQCYEVDDL